MNEAIHQSASTKISLESVRRQYGGVPLSKFDQFTSENFDVDERCSPETDQYKRFDAFASEHYFSEKACNVLEGVALADINLRMRGLVGLVIGSSMRELTSPPADLKEIFDHRDFDVLVLQQHSSKHPAPNEWGVDWWVRPEGRAPTNGRMELWYDIALENGVMASSQHREEQKVQLDPQKKLITIDHRLDYRDADIGQVHAGLYLPDAHIAEEIVRHCEEKSQGIRTAVDGILAQVTAMKIDFCATTLINFGKLRGTQEQNILSDYYRLLNILSVGIVSIQKLIDTGFAIIARKPQYLRNYEQKEIYEAYKDGNFSTLQKAGKDFLEMRIEEFQQTAAMVIRDNYDYLSIGELPDKDPLLPILPHQLLSFKGL